MLSGGIFAKSDSLLPTSLATFISTMNNSTSILPSTRVDLHNLYSDETFLSTYQAVCSQLQHSAFTIFSGVKQDAVISDVLKTFHVPHFSTEIVTEREMMERPFTLFLGPSREDMTWMIESTVRAVVQPYSKIALITHQTSALLSTSLLASLQGDKLEVLVEHLVEKDIRPSLARLRMKGVKTMVVDISSSLVKPFLYQVSSV